MDLYHLTCSRENWCCKKCSGCPTEHVFHSLPHAGLLNLLWFGDKVVFRLFTNCNVVLQIPHKSQLEIVFCVPQKYLHSQRSIDYSVFQLTSVISLIMPGFHTLWSSNSDSIFTIVIFIQYFKLQCMQCYLNSFLNCLVGDLQNPGLTITRPET